MNCRTCGLILPVEWGGAWAARILAEGEEGQTDWREPDRGKGSKMEREGAQALRRAAVAAVGRRMAPAKVGRSRRRPAARGSRQGRGMRMLARTRAGQRLLRTALAQRQV